MITLKLHMLHSQIHCSLSGPSYMYRELYLTVRSSLLLTLQDAINQTFWPTLFQASVSEPETKLFSLPARLGGMGVRNPVSMAQHAFTTSRSCTDQIVQAIKSTLCFSLFDHN